MWSAWLERLEAKRIIHSCWVAVGTRHLEDLFRKPALLLHLRSKESFISHAILVQEGTARRISQKLSLLLIKRRSLDSCSLSGNQALLWYIIIADACCWLGYSPAESTNWTSLWCFVNRAHQWMGRQRNQKLRSWKVWDLSTSLESLHWNLSESTSSLDEHFELHWEQILRQARVPQRNLRAKSYWGVEGQFTRALQGKKYNLDAGLYNLSWEEE